MYNLRCFLTLLLSILVSVYDDGYAATIINIAPTGSAAYSITATDLQESAGIDLLISYDTATLETPKVKSGALATGAMMEANVSTSGVVRIVFITAGAIKGTGELASVTFTKKGTTPAPPLKLSSSVYAASGSQLAVQSTSVAQQQEAGTDSPNKDSKTPSAGTAGAPVVSSSGTMATIFSPITPQVSTTSGSVSFPQETVVKNDPARQGASKDGLSEEPEYMKTPADTPAVAVGSAAVTVALPEIKAAGALHTLKSNQSVLDSFRVYKDMRTVKQLSALFKDSGLHTTGIVQSPPIVVSDGKTIVTVAVDLSAEAAPSFSLKGANMKSIRRVSDKKWEIDALPQKGKSDIRLSILLKGERTEAPLVVVPTISQEVAGKLATLSVVALDAMLATPLKNNKPAYDMNNDRKQDYVDDYILIGHWLLMQQRSVNGAARKPAAAGK